MLLVYPPHLPNPTNQTGILSCRGFDLDPLANRQRKESGEEKEGSQALEAGLLLHRKVLLPVGCF